MSRNPFDEMQTQQRNRIGNQSFTLLVLLLLLDTLLYSMGVRLVEYPTNIFIIVMICYSVYVIRSALSDSLIAPKQKIGRSITLMLITTILSMTAVVALGAFIKPQTASKPQSSIGLILLEVISWGILLTAGIIYLVRRHCENNRDK